MKKPTLALLFLGLVQIPMSYAQQPAGAEVKSLFKAKSVRCANSAGSFFTMSFPKARVSYDSSGLRRFIPGEICFVSGAADLQNAPVRYPEAQQMHYVIGDNYAVGLYEDHGPVAYFEWGYQDYSKPRVTRGQLGVWYKYSDRSKNNPDLECTLFDQPLTECP